jgi:hypothetical protein
MSSFTLRYPASAIAGKLRLTAEDIMLLRKHMFPRGVTSADDAQQLLALHRAAQEKCAEWDNWFVETMAAFIVSHLRHQQWQGERDLDWLIGMLSRNGKIETPAELELLLHVMEMAAGVPDALSAFALDQLRIALETGAGAYAATRNAKRSGIAADDIEFIFRILRDSLSAGRMMLSKREVAALDRIGALVHGRANHPAWKALVQSVVIRVPQSHGSANPWLHVQVNDALLGLAA